MTPPKVGARAACLLGLVLILQAVAASQEDEAVSLPPELAPYRESTRKILEESLRRGQAYENLRELCRRAPGRLSGSPSAALAVEWAKATMEAGGLENVRLEPVLVPQWRRGKVARLRVVKPESASGTLLPVCALGGSVPTAPGGTRAAIVEAKSLGDLRRIGEEAKGKIVFLNQPMDPALLQTFQAYGGAVSCRVSGAVEAARLGALAVVIRSVASNLDDHPHTGAMRYADDVTKIPAGAVSTLGADRLAALIAAGEPVEVEFELDSSWHDDVPSSNVIGEIKGREKPEEVVVVGGHLDSWDLGEGAHDDGAGCVQSIEVPRLLLALGLRPRRTIRCVLFMNEENGLRGGRAYAETHAAELDRHVFAIESDRGGFTPRGFSSDADPETITRLRAIARLLGNAGADRVWAGEGGADISPLSRARIPLMGFVPDCHRYFDLHHSAADRFDSVNERELELGAACITVMAQVIADLETPLPRNRPRGGSGDKNR